MVVGSEISGDCTGLFSCVNGKGWRVGEEERRGDLSPCDGPTPHPHVAGVVVAVHPFARKVTKGK